MSLTDKTVKIEIDSTMHARGPENEQERMIWAILDTAWNLLREGALHSTIYAVRKSIEDAGATTLTDEQIFESLKDNPDAPRNYREMAPADPRAQAMVSAAFHLLLSESMSWADEAVNGGACDRH